MRREELVEGRSYTRPARTIAAETVEVVEIQPVMVRVKHDDGTIGAIPIREFIRYYGPEDEA